MCLKVCCYSNSFSARKIQHLTGQRYENSRNYKAITTLLTHYCIVMVLFPNYSSPQLANFQDRILQQGFHKWLWHKIRMQYEEDIKQSEKNIFKKRKLANLQNSFCSWLTLSPIFPVPMWSTLRGRTWHGWMEEISKTRLKKNTVSLACKAAEQESWARQQ